MKDLKFKAWDKKLKLMAEVISLSFYTNDSPYYGKETESFLFYPTINNFNLRAFKDIALLQYIGVDDINHKEIYEGGVLRSDDPQWGYGGEYDKTHDSYRYEVVMSLEAYLSEPDEYDYCDFSKKELIGNIYMNPELLEKIR